MKRQVFARAYPAEVRCEETYHYYVEVSSNPRLEQLQEPEGRIYLRIPYDGHSCFGREAWKDVRRQLGSAAPPGQLDALIGHLGFRNHQPTNLDRVLSLTDRNDVIPLAVPLLGEGLTSLDKVRADRYECRITHAYTPEPPEVFPIQVEATLLDEEYLDEIEAGTKSDQQALVNMLVRRTSFRRALVLRLDVQLYISTGVIRGKLSPKLREASLRWPRPISYRALELYIGDNEDNDVEGDLTYNPEGGRVGWQNISLRDDGLAPGTGLRRYTVPAMWLHVPRPGDLYQLNKLHGSLKIEVPNVVLSGVQPLYFSAFGSGLMKEFVTLSTTIRADIEIYLEDCFRMRTVSPYRHLQFEGVILDDMRTQDIVTLLRDRGFEIVESAEQPLESGDAYRAWVVGTKQESGSTMDLLIRADGTRTTTTRKTEIPGGQTFTTPIATGNMKIYMSGQFNGDSYRLTKVMNDIQMSLKERLRHVSTLD